MTFPGRRLEKRDSREGENRWMCFCVLFCFFFLPELTVLNAASAVVVPLPARSSSPSALTG